MGVRYPPVQDRYSLHDGDFANTDAICQCRRSAGGVVSLADIVIPLAHAVAWMLRRLGFSNQPRISGTELMRAYMAQAAPRAEPIFLLGGTEEALAALKRNLMAEFPALIIAGAISPPFRPITDEEDAAMVAQINASGVRTVWVGLKLPKPKKNGCWRTADGCRLSCSGSGQRSTSFPAPSHARQRGCARRGSSGCIAWPASLAGCGSAILATNTLFVIGAARQLLFERH